MPARSARKVALPRSSSSAAKARCTAAVMAGSSACNRRWLSVWPSGIEPHASGYPVRHDGGQESVERGRQRNAVTGAADTDRYRISDRTIPNFSEFSERLTGPRRLCHFDEGAAQRRRFKMALTRWHEGCRKLGEFNKTGMIAPGDGTMRLRKENAVAQSRAQAQHGFDPPAQACGASDIASLDSPFDAARIRKRADRIGRRKPDHQPV